MRSLNLLLTCLFLVSPIFAQDQPAKIATEDDLKNDLTLVPCKNSERLDAVKQLFRAKGAADTDVSVGKFGNVQNLIVTKKGSTDNTIIVGAHYDKVDAGCGAIDNWTGVVIIANIYQAIRNARTDKTYLFVAFDKEEVGLVGSNDMAKAIPKEKRVGYCAMVNLDSFGYAYPQVMDNTSTAKMVDLARDLAKELKMPFHHAAISNADADSDSFKSRDIPAITFHGLSNNWQTILHSSNDKLSNINVSSVLAGLQFTLRYIAKIDSVGCAEFRKR